MSKEEKEIKNTDAAEKPKKTKKEKVKKEKRTFNKRKFKYGTRLQELYRFDNVNAAAEMIKIRYCLIPYLYSEFLKAALNDEMMFKPLAFDFPDDDMAKQTDDQLLLGNELMIAPVYKQNANGRYVYLPEEMMLVRMRSWDNYETQILSKGHHFVDVSLDELVFFIRSTKSIPFGKPSANTGEIDFTSLELIGFPNTAYELYSDNGFSPVPEDSLTVTEYLKYS